jgi:hypothetical protein
MLLKAVAQSIFNVEFHFLIIIPPVWGGFFARPVGLNVENLESRKNTGGHDEELVQPNKANCTRRIPCRSRDGAHSGVDGCDAIYRKHHNDYD